MGRPKRRETIGNPQFVYASDAAKILWPHGEPKYESRLRAMVRDDLLHPTKDGEGRHRYPVAELRARARAPARAESPSEPAHVVSAEEERLALLEEDRLQRQRAEQRAAIERRDKAK